MAGLSWVLAAAAAFVGTHFLLWSGCQQRGCTSRPPDGQQASGVGFRDLAGMIPWLHHLELTGLTP